MYNSHANNERIWDFHCSARITVSLKYCMVAAMTVKQSTNHVRGVINYYHEADRETKH